jgi:hypothetical protein
MTLLIIAFFSGNAHVLFVKQMPDLYVSSILGFVGAWRSHNNRIYPLHMIGRYHAPKSH